MSRRTAKQIADNLAAAAAARAAAQPPALPEPDRESVPLGEVLRERLTPAEQAAAAAVRAGIRRPPLLPERHPNRDFFLCDLLDYALKDDAASMEAPIFSLRAGDKTVWTWQSQDGKRSVTITPSVLGRATMFDKDVLIYCVSQLVEAQNRGRADAGRVVRFTVYDFMVTTNRDTGGRDYKLLLDAFRRLRGTTLETDIRTGGKRVREGFGLIENYKIVEKSPDDQRMIAVEVRLSEWLYNAVRTFEVLTISRQYFRLRKPLERRLYEIARKHCGEQGVWRISLDKLHSKSGSRATLKEFSRGFREIIDADQTPDYRFEIGNDGIVTVYDRDPAAVARALLPPA